MKFHATKCGKWIIKVISPSIKWALPRDMDGKKYSLLESINTSVTQNLSLVVSYLNESLNEINSPFFEIWKV